MEAPRVALISSLPPDQGGQVWGGGIAFHTAQLVRHLVQRGTQVTVLAQNIFSPAPRSWVDRDGFAVHRFAPVRSVASVLFLAQRPRRIPWRVLLGACGIEGLRLSPRRRLTVLLLAAQYGSFLRGVRPDLAHFHGIGLGLLAAHLAARRQGLPLVATVHSLRGHLPGRLFFHWVLPSLARADAVITVSDALREEALGYGIPGDRVHAIPNGVDTGYFHPLDKRDACRALDIPADASNILLVGNLIRTKGADLLIRAFAHVCQKGHNARLYIVGGPTSDTEKSWLRETQALPRLLGIEDRVSFVGPVESHRQPTLNWWYNAADVVVLPSRDEGMGMVLVEAMACGKPVIGASVGGIASVIRHGENGLLVPPEDVAGLSGAISEVLARPDFASRLVHNGLRDVQATYLWDTVAERTAQVYEDVARSAH